MTDQGRLLHLDVWRTIAVTLVVLAHLPPNSGVEGASAGSPLGFLYGYGLTGVYIFFFISGLVVSRTALAELTATGDFSRRGFYIRRFFRIVPPLLFYLSTCLVLGLFNVIEFPLADFFSAALYTCNIGLADCKWYVSHTWSLAFEEQFYLLFPMLFLWVEKSVRPKVWPMVVLGILAILPLTFPYKVAGHTGFLITYAMFMLGYYFARTPPAWVESPARNFLFIAGLIVTFFPAAIFAHPAIYKYHKFMFVFSIPLVVLCSGSVQLFARRFFENRTLAHVGKASYSIYLWQQLMTSELLSSMPPLLHLALGVTVLGGCLLSYQFVERPLIQLGRRLAA